MRAPNGRVTMLGRYLGSPISIAVTGDGSILIGDGIAGSVTAFTSGWEPLFLLGQGPGELLSPGDIAVDPASGNIYVTDTMANRVNVPPQERPAP